MKKHFVFSIGFLLGCAQFLLGGEKPWTPELPYNTDRRLSSSAPVESRWDYSIEARNVEYRLLYLLEADKNAMMLMRHFKDFDQETATRVMKISGDLDEVLECSYREAIPYFKKTANPTLLLMMLYHYQVYCRGSAMERWAGTISSLRDIDPKITGKAKLLADEAEAKLRRSEQD